MSSIKTIQDALGYLKSTKVKDRQEGVEAIRLFFDSERNIDKFRKSSGQQESKTWIALFQAIFQHLLREKEAFVKPAGKGKAASTGGEAARKRVVDAANLVRWLVQKTVHFLSKKAVKTIFQHIHSLITHAKVLFAPVALDFAKTLRTLLNHRPQLEHIDPEEWFHLLELSFNVTLGHPPKAPFEPHLSSHPFDSDSSDDEESDVTVLGRKRRRGTSSTPESPVKSSRRKKRLKLAVTVEQVEFNHIVSILLSHTRTPILSRAEQYKDLPSSIFTRLQYFLTLYEPDSTLYDDFLQSLLSALSHIALNRKAETVKFARNVWLDLVGLWGTKNKLLKEKLVAIFYSLLPYVTALPDHPDLDLSVSNGWTEGLWKLWTVLDADVARKWGVDVLDADALRFDIQDAQSIQNRAFVTNTFCAGPNFDTNQALTWAVLELQADCAAMLFRCSESHLSGIASGGGKIRTENPVLTLLRSLASTTPMASRVFRLQVLLFIIDRHWSILHQALQQSILKTLQDLQLDATVHPWTFLCYGAIAYTSSIATVSISRPGTNLRRDSDSTVNTDWGSVLEFIVRRATMPSVCRTACHTAQVIIESLFRRSTPGSPTILSSRQTLGVVETFMKDLDIQGPDYPYDSVCQLISLCLRIASQDVKLFRLQLEDTALNWLMGCWKSTDVPFGPLVSEGDIITVLETICGCTEQSQLDYTMTIPKSLISGTLNDEGVCKVIREFSLYAALPNAATQLVGGGKSVSTGVVPAKERATREQDLRRQKGRDLKISKFLTRQLNEHAKAWSVRSPQLSTLRSEDAFDYMRTAVVALIFQGVEQLNGTHVDRYTVKGAYKLIASITPLLKESLWTMSEKAKVMTALAPLVNVGLSRGSNYQVPFEAVVSPGRSSGMRAGVPGLNSPKGNSTDGSRTVLYRLIWQCADAEDFFTSLLSELRGVLNQILGDGGEDIRVDDADGFAEPHSNGRHNTSTDDQHIQSISQICFDFLIIGPVLQSLAGEPTRDKDLEEALIDCADGDEERFLLILPMFLEHLRNNTLTLPPNSMISLLTVVGGLLQSSPYKEALQLVVFSLLDSTVHIWASSTSLEEPPHEIQMLCQWIESALEKDTFASWRVCDSVIRFLDRYIGFDPQQRHWIDMGQLPSDSLLHLGVGVDMRNRFRAGTVVARLFSLTSSLKMDGLQLYTEIHGLQSTNLDDYEEMLSRSLLLGNIMIASSAVRRGPYWHILEPSLVPAGRPYLLHSQAVLAAVAQRLGLASLSTLFEAYSFHIAQSLGVGDYDCFSIPPQLVGYHDRREYCQKTLRPFSPINLLKHGVDIFRGHCDANQITVEDGLEQCFGDIVALEVLHWLAFNPECDPATLLKSQLRVARYSADFDFLHIFERRADSIATSILRLLSEFGERGHNRMLEALGSVDDEMARVFSDLTKYKSEHDFETHEPNQPHADVVLVLRAIQWLQSQLPPETNYVAISYHVTHTLFSTLHQSPLLNEQIRILNAVALWTAYTYKTYDRTTIHASVRGACSVLSQPDLCRPAQSILEWSFTQYRHHIIRDPRTPDYLIRIACISYEHAQSNNPRDAETGANLMDWVEDQAAQFGALSELREQVIFALSAWPREPPSDLLTLLAGSDPKQVLRNDRLSSSKFRVVRRLFESKNHDPASFSTRDFWDLRSSIPPTAQLREEDMLAFTQLLMLNRGQVSSAGWGNQRTISSSEVQKTSPEASIILSLLTILDGHDAARIHLAYTTLRSIMSTDPVLDHHFPRESSSEVKFLQLFPIPVATIIPGDIRDVEDDTYRNACSDFPTWIGKVTTLLVGILSAMNPLYAQLHSILIDDAAFAEAQMPLLVRKLLEHQDFNTVYRPRLSAYFSSILLSPDADISCLRTIVDVVLHLRNVNRTRQSDTIQDHLMYNKWLQLDFTLLAQTALRCGAYTTALLFLELAADNEQDVKLVGTTLSPEQIMYEIYSNIDEPDGFYGIKDQNHSQFLIKRFHHERQWEKAFRFHGAALEAGSMDETESEGLLKAFHSIGFNHLASRTSHTLHSTDDRLGSTMTYRLGWRTEVWDLPDHQEGRIPGNALYLALRADHRDRDRETIQETLKRGMYREMQHLRTLGSENITQIRDVVQSLMCLCQVAEWKGLQGSERSILPSQSEDTDIRTWDKFINLENGFEFTDVENIMATRVSLVRSAKTKESRKQLGSISTSQHTLLSEVEGRCLLRISQAARESQQTQIALNAVTRAGKIGSLDSFEVSLELANVLWCYQEKNRAVQLLSTLRSAMSSAEDDMNMSAINSTLGTWTNEACLEKPAYILEHYFLPAIDTARKTQPTSNSNEHARIYHACAIFTEHQYYSVARSPDVVRRKLYLELKKEEVRRLEGQVSRGMKDAEQLLRRARTLKTEDETIYNQLLQERNNFLMLAIDMYSRCLQMSDSYDDDSAVRFCSMWLANFDDSTLEDFPKNVAEALGRVASRKFTFLAHQISARISDTKNAPCPENQQTLQRLVLKMCQEHPFHSLYQVFCLQPAPDPPSQTKSRQSGRLSNVNSPPALNDRTRTTKALFDHLRSSPSDIRTSTRLKDVEKLCIASVEWANYPIKKQSYKENNTYGLPSSLRIRNMNKLKVPVMTARTPLDPSKQYSNCIWIEKFADKFTVAGGNSKPKIHVCTGMDGIGYKALYKGEEADDLRQDAVMEQVFDLVNRMLRNDSESRRRNLSVREYKVIPLGEQVGVIEFVGMTQTIRSWLDPAHRKYNPLDLDPGKAAIELRKIKAKTDREASMQSRLDEFQDLRTKRFRPVMRHYFTEHHKTPMSWFGMRLNYIRSVATTSIVGHILGLGDRHTSNILIDTVTGEVVHIDLGISFDQGKLLPIPEMVPFRMTGDMVDGMGISGTDGVFHRCAEETLRVMRASKEVIITILEVFRHDPLHTWTASELKVKRAQGEVNPAPTPPVPPPTAAGTFATNFYDTNTGVHHNLGIGITLNSGGADEAADRALTGVQRKLDGALSVESTVSGLIAEAKDPGNLFAIFQGWGPHY